MESEFPSNSHAKKVKAVTPEPAERQKKVDKVIEGTIVRKKTPMGRRFLDTFVSGEGAKSVFGYVVFEVMIPAARDLVVDAGQEALQRAFYPDGGGHSRRRSGTRYGGGGGGHVRYDLASSKRRDPREERLSRRDRATHNFDRIYLDTRHEADAVLEGLYILVSDFGQASVADLYDLLGETAAYTDQKWGWTDLEGSRITHTSSGYLMDLPKPYPLRDN